jgi:hypothetical protein
MWVALAAAALAACGGPERTPEAGEPAESAEPKGGGVLLDAARAPLERASEVEDIAATRKAELDAQLERAE